MLVGPNVLQHFCIRRLQHDRAIFRLGWGVIPTWCLNPPPLHRADDRGVAFPSVDAFQVSTKRRARAEKCRRCRRHFQRARVAAEEPVMALKRCEHFGA